MLAVFGFAGSLAATCLMTMMQAAFYDSLYQQTSAETYSSPFVIQLICLGFVIPLAEEFMFRGVLYKRYRERQNFWYSAIGSSILFSLMHVSMTQMFYTFLLGLVGHFYGDRAFPSAHPGSAGTGRRSDRRGVYLLGYVCSDTEDRKCKDQYLTDRV